MWYVYKNDDKWLYSKTEPNCQHIETKRMPPKPVKDGYDTTLMADFDTGKVWYEQSITEPGMASQIRTKRDTLLADCDWTQCLDAPIDDETVMSYRIYRQSLRDITEQDDFPYSVEWPEMPGTTKADPEPAVVEWDEMAAAITEGVNSI